MTKTLKKLLTLFLMTALIIALTACGLAEPSKPNVNPDTSNPEVINSSPLNNTELSYAGDQKDLILTLKKIILTINEAIDPASLIALNALEFKSDTSVLKGEWTFNSDSNQLTFNLDESNRPVQEQTFTLNINGEATDLAGNPLIWNLSYHTPDLLNINFIASGLSEGDSVTITQTKQNSNEINKITIDKNGEVYTLDANLSSGDFYYLYIRKYSLKLMSIGSTSELPAQGKNSVIAAKINNDYYHIRIFNTKGEIDIDQGKDEFSPDAELKKALDNALATQEQGQEIDPMTENDHLQMIASTVNYDLSATSDSNFCALNKTNGQVLSTDTDIKIKCHNVKPVNSTKYNWNQYYLNDDPQWVHGGEQRVANFSDIPSCEGITATDLLDAFDWTCKEKNVNNNPQINITSTNLKITSDLRSLMDLDTKLAWKENQITVFRNGQQIAESDRGTWWTNQIVIAGTTKLATENVIFIVEGQAMLSRSFEIAANGISMLIRSGDTFQPTSIKSGLTIASNTVGTWFEGEVDSRFSEIGILIKNASFATINASSVYNSKGNGIEIIDSIYTRITNINASSNGENGINIGGVQSNSLNNLQKVTASNNASSGINLTGNGVALYDVNSASNNEHGIIISGNNNKLINISSSNNRIDGIVISGGSNNIVNAATTSSNGNNGIRFSISSGVNNARNNLLSNISITNNLESGINFDDLNDNNNLINLLDAYNATSNCPDTSCDNVSVISTEDIATTDLFSPITEESNIPNYSPNAPKHIASARELTLFDNQYRAWGNAILATTDAGGGTCNNENNSINGTVCLLFDWSLNIADETFARNQLSAVNTTQEHTFVNGDVITFLTNSIEISGDGIGNDNSLCETDENCLLTPNIGSYQGHGSLIELNESNDLNATLYQFEINGRP